MQRFNANIGKSSRAHCNSLLLCKHNFVSRCSGLKLWTPNHWRTLSQIKSVLMLASFLCNQMHQSVCLLRLSSSTRQDWEIFISLAERQDRTSLPEEYLLYVIAVRWLCHWYISPLSLHICAHFQLISLLSTVKSFAETIASSNRKTTGLFYAEIRQLFPVYAVCCYDSPNMQSFFVSCFQKRRILPFFTTLQFFSQLHQWPHPSTLCFFPNLSSPFVKIYKSEFLSADSGLKC